jgi:timeless
MATLAAAVHTVLALLRALSDAADGTLHVTRKRAKRTKKKVAPVDPDAEADPNADPEAAANGAANGTDANGAADGAGGDAGAADGDGGAGKEMDADKAAALADAGIDMGDDDDDLEEDGPGGGSGSDGEGNQRRRLKEVKLDLPKRVARLVDAQTVCNYVWLLKHWRSNDTATNDVACAFLERLERLTLSPMLYQLSVLTIVHDVLADPAARREPRHARLYAFCRRTTRGLFERMLPPLPVTPEAAERPPAGDDSDSDAERERAAAAAADTADAAAAKARVAAGRMLCVDMLFWKQRTQALQMEIDFGRMDENGPPGSRTAKVRVEASCAACAAALSSFAFRLALTLRAAAFAAAVRG